MYKCLRQNKTKKLTQTKHSFVLAETLVSPDQVFPVPDKVH